MIPFRPKYIEVFLTELFNSFEFISRLSDKSAFAKIG